MSITLSYSTYEVELLSQNINSVDTFELPLQIGNSSNNTIYTYKKTTYKRTFSFSFTNVRQSIIDSLEELILASAGQKVTLTDHAGDNWSVYILTNPLEVGYERYLNGTCKDAGGFTLQMTGTALVISTDSLLLETGDYILLENGDKLLLEA